MTTYKISKDKMKELLNSIKGYDVYVPTELGDKFQFKVLKDVGDARLDYSQSAKPPKDVVFPQNEVLMDYKIVINGFEIEQKLDAVGKYVIFGIRNCDARALKYLDTQMLNGKFIDPYYAKRRENTTVVGLACNTPLYNCFCKSVGAGPHHKEGHDIHLTELDDGYLVEIITDKGKELMANSMSLLAEASEGDTAKQADLKKACEDKFVRKLDIKDNDAKMQEIFESDYWRDVSDGCIGCGICTLLCPTCFCFDIQDIGSRKAGQRVRVWDSCQSCELGHCQHIMLAALPLNLFSEFFIFESFHGFSFLYALSGTLTTNFASTITTFTLYPNFLIFPELNSTELTSVFISTLSSLSYS